ncbi:hypothetical protein [Ruminococcus sp.]|uniref:hypothetical protein n=1 Tax=Ruminococcus sp. TaxID=41978 RepID=UPI002587E6C9|nr:hypothetical protein [Ruminococcus sp.]MCR5020871.1 hypothetical protein [Ruminococcus sp.]
MKTKTCPYCGKELSGEAVLCKFCHNLLIDEDGKMTSEGGVDDETKVFKKPDDDMTKRFVLPENARNDGGSGKNGKAVIADSDAEDVFPDDFDDYGDDGYDDDNYGDRYNDDNYGDDSEEDAARKRLFVITAVITIGILIIVIAAIFVGMRLFGKKGSSDNNAQNGGARPAATSTAEKQPQTDVAEDDENTEPEVTTPVDDVASQPVESAAETESGAQQTESSAADTSSQSDTDSSAVNFAEPGNDSSSSAADGDSSSSQASDSSQAEVDISDLENTVRAAVAGEINGDITGSQFRTELDGYAYYYFFTDNGAHGYSVAYNMSTGSYVCEQNY